MTWDQWAHRGLQAASVLAWLALLIAYRRDPRRTLPKIERRLAPWGLIDLALAVLAWAAVLAAGQFLLARRIGAAPSSRLEDLPSDAVGPWIVGAATSLLLATAVGVLLVSRRSGARPADWLGDFSLRSPLRDTAVGLGAFLLAAAPVLGLQELLTRWFPSRHPLVELLQATPRFDWLACAAFSAVIVAPLVEELQFRVLLQGWLMRVAESGESADEWLHGDGVTERRTGRSPFWPAAASAAVFALAHWSHGPDPIPLFLFAIGLGELYRRTRRLLPVVVAHAALNAWSLLLLTADLLRRTG